MTTQAEVIRRRGRAGVSLILLFLSWPVCLIHRFWNNSKPQQADWFLMKVFNPDGTPYTQDIQWYLVDTGNMLSTTLIILSLVIVREKTTSYRLALSVVLAISIIDIIHYWLCFKQLDLIVTMEGLLMLLAALLILLRKWKKVSKSGKRSSAP